MVRIVSVPVLLVIYPMNTGFTDYLCAMIFLVAAITDFFDGYLARKYDSITRLGMLLDPIADKMLSGACMIILAYSQHLSAWMAGVLLCRDIGITGLRLVALEQGIRINVSQLGKWKTFFQDIGIFGLMLNHDAFGLPWLVTASIAMWLTLGVSLYSGFLYVREFLAQSKETLSS